MYIIRFLLRGKTLRPCYNDNSVITADERKMLMILRLYGTDTYEMLKHMAYTRRFRKNLPYFGKTFLILSYIFVTEKTYIRDKF